MKRHKPLLGNPDTHREWQQRSRDAALQRARQGPKRAKDTGPSRKTKDRLSARSGRRCELCGRPLIPGTRQVHHRQPRAIGGSSRPEINALSNLLDLCRDDHWLIEHNRIWAAQHGLLVPHPLIPAVVPAGLRYGRVLLDDHGGWTAADDHHDDLAGAVA